MPTFKTFLYLQVRAASAPDAQDVALGAAEHLLDTFNDDESIKPGIQIVPGDAAVIVPAAMLAALLEAADCATDDQFESAHELRRDGERSGAAQCSLRALAWSTALRAGRACLARSQPRKTRAKRMEELHATP